MAEQAKITYKRLFEIRIIHHYYLDEGSTDFASLPEDVQTDRLLNGYDVRRFFDLQPTPDTEKQLKGLSCTFKQTALGCLVGAPETIDLPTDAVFEFTLAIADPAIVNNTALTLLPRKIYEFQLNEDTYRFKENVLVLSNATGVKRTINILLRANEPATKDVDLLCLSQEFPAYTNTNYPAEAFALSGSELYQSIKDDPATGNPTPPASDWQLIAGNKANVPVYVNQNDIPALVPPAGITGAPPKGIELKPGIPDAVLALIRIEPLLPANDFSLLKPGGLREPVFQLHFKNRSTIWRYYKKSTQTPVSLETAPLPLTRFGNAGTKQKPSEGFVKVPLTPAKKIIGLFSDIYE